MSTPSTDSGSRFWAWWLLLGFIGLVVWSAVDFSRRLGKHTAVNAKLAAAGTAPGDAWLAQLRTDPAAAHAAATAGFRGRVSADRLAAWVKATPAVTDPAATLRLQSFGGGRVTQNWVGPSDDRPPRLVLAGPGGLALEFIEADDSVIRLDAVRVGEADPFADAG